MDRKDYIGSSDARDILSADWTRLYARKTTGAEDDLSDKFHVQLGTITEPFHLDWIARRLNEQDGADAWEWSKAQKDGTQHFSAFRPDQAMNGVVLGSHPDCLFRHLKANVYPAEAKITGRFKTAEEAADFYMPQLQHHMICWGVDRLLFSVSINCLEPERLWIGYSQEWADHYVGRCLAFWQHVEDRLPPAPPMSVNARTPQVPTPVKDSVPINGMKRRHLTEGSNRAAALVDEFLTTHAAVAAHEAAKKELKGMMKEDEKELYSDRLTLKRDARGAIRFTIHDDKAAAA